MISAEYVAPSGILFVRVSLLVDDLRSDRHPIAPTGTLPNLLANVAGGLVCALGILSAPLYREIKGGFDQVDQTHMVRKAVPFLHPRVVEVAARSLEAD